MSWQIALIWVAIFVLLAVIGSGVIGPGTESRDSRRSENVVVTHVVDGDTVKVRLDSGGLETVRYIGVDTPETKKPDTPIQCFGPAASSFNTRATAHKTVRLRFDRERRDRYGRLLAYVYRQPDGLFVNAALIKSGMARTLAIEPNTAHAAGFDRLAHRARNEHKGLWKVCN